MNKLIFISLFAFALPLHAEEYITKPIPALEAGILSDKEEIQGMEKNKKCFIRIFRTNYKETIQYHIDYSTEADISQRTSSNKIYETLWSVDQLKEITDNSVEFTNMKENPLSKRVTWLVQMDERTRKLISVEYKDGMLARTKKCDL